MDVSPNLFATEYEECVADVCQRDEQIVDFEMKCSVMEDFGRNEHEEE